MGSALISWKAMDLGHCSTPKVSLRDEDCPEHIKSLKGTMSDFSQNSLCNTLETTGSL